jgi:hypothetical protein
VPTPSQVKLEGWKQGLNTLLRDDSLPVDALRRCVNYDINDTGRLSVRAGRVKVYNGSIQDGSMWSNDDRTLFVESGDLKELVRNLDGSYSAIMLRSGVGSYPMKYVSVNGITYYSNGLVTGAISEVGINRPWGLQAPGNQPNVAAVGGGELADGRYQVAITFVRSGGEESGTPLAASADVAAAGGSLLLTDFPPAPAGTAAIRVYCSHVNGEGLYRVTDIPAAQTTYQITKVSNTATILLRTQFCVAPPGGQLLEYHNGRIYIASGKVLWFTEPLRYGCVHPGRGFLLFPSDITVVKAVSDGLYVCSDLTYFVSGVDSADFKQREVLPYGGVYDTGVSLPNYDAVAWFSHQGLVFGARNAELLNVTQDRVAISKYASGTMQVRELNGLRQLVANFRDGELSTFAAPDYLALEVARAGAAYT